MGNTIATNALNDSIKQMLNVTSNIVAQQGSSITNVNSIVISGNCQLNSPINQNIDFHISAENLQNALSSINTSQALDVEAKQIADTVSQNFSLNPGRTASQDFIDLFTDLATTLDTNIKQNCINIVENVNKLDCSGGTVAPNIVLNQTIVGDALFKCTQKAVANSVAYTKIQQQLSQSATATVQNGLAIILAIIAVIILLVMGGPVLGLKKVFSSILIKATVLFGLVLLDCYLTKL